MDSCSDTPLRVFRAALDGPLGPTPLAYALRLGFDEVAALRRAGASWAQIVVEINACLGAAGRSGITVATLRGMMGRLARNTMASGVNAGGAGNRAGSANLPILPPDRIQPPVAAQFSSDSMQGELARKPASMLDEAAEMAAKLQRIRDIK